MPSIVLFPYLNSSNLEIFPNIDHTIVVSVATLKDQVGTVIGARDPPESWRREDY